LSQRARQPSACSLGGTLPQGPFHRLPGGQWSNAPPLTGSLTFELE
jgi:hypothetical protein